MASKSISQYTEKTSLISGDKLLLERSGVYYYIDGTNIGSNEFADDVFRVQDNADDTKELAFEVSGITTATTRTWTVADRNQDFAQFYGNSGFIGIGTNTQDGSEILSLGGDLNFRNQDYITIGGSRFLHYKSSGGDDWNDNNIFLGRNVGTSNTGSNNLGFGANTMNGTLSGVGNTGIGGTVFQSLTTGSNNIGIGLNSLQSMVSFSGSTAVGKDSGLNATGAENTFFGLVAGRRITSATGTVAIGAYAMHDNSTTVTGTQNVSVGYQSGNLINGVAARNTHIGAQTGFYQSATYSYSTAIGYGSTNDASNQVVIGNGVNQVATEIIIGNPLTHKSQAGSISATDIDLRAGNPKYWDGAAVDQTNLGGHNLHIKAGAAHGNGNAGDLVLYSGDTGASGSTERGYTEQIKIQGDTGYIIMANLPTSSAGLPTGALWNNSGVLTVA